MKSIVPSGVWPTMLTPFTEENTVDYDSLERLIEWYIQQQVHGLFAVCQSSEMFFLTLDERVEIARFVVEKTAGRVPVVASGHVADHIDQQAEEIRRMVSTGIDAFVLVSNRLAGSNESDEVWKRNAEILLNEIQDISFGIYECPYPSKRLLSPELLKWCSDTGRFSFLKDTCCDLDQIRLKLDAVKGTNLKIYNANTATLLDSLRMGASGFSGILANFYPDLFVWMVENWQDDPLKAESVQSFLGPASLIELQNYPVNAKYHLQSEGIIDTMLCRVKDAAEMTSSQRMEVGQLKQLYGLVRKQLHI